MTNEVSTFSVSLTSLPHDLCVISAHQGSVPSSHRAGPVCSRQILKLKYNLPRAHCDFTVLVKLLETLEHSFIAVVICNIAPSQEVDARVGQPKSQL